MITAKFMLERETKGAIRYQEIDAAGEPLKQDQAKVGTLYVRKTALDGDKPPFIEITVKPIEID